MRFKTLQLLFASMILLAACGTAEAQLILTNTTLSAAVTSSQRNIPLTSTTGVLAPSYSNGQAATFLLIDAEEVSVSNVTTTGGTQITVVRGVGGTAARSHASGALVFVIPAYIATQFSSQQPTGSCTRSSVLALPVITVQANGATLSDCLAGQWVNGDSSQTSRATWYRLEAPTIGAVANTAALGTSTATTAAELYCTEIRIPYSKLLTGLAPHIGATGGTDKWIVALYDSGGNLIANSALAGATVGTANTWQATAFTTPYYVVGPGQYYGCLMSNGTTATADLVKTGTDDNILTFKSATGGTFGTLPNFTAPTGFTTLNGAFLYAY